jgi:inosine-uridine nucleoside N-ribohydrolase
MSAIRLVGIALALLLSVVAGACGASVPTAPGLSGLPTSTATAKTTGTVPVLIDTDMAADDIIAIAVLLRDPAVAVRAITVDGTGEVHCSAGIPNVLRILDALGVTRVKVGCGRETPGPNGRSFPAEWRAAVDDMYGLDLPHASATTADGDAVSLIRETAAASGGGLTIVALGPWTNIADALTADPSLATGVAGIHAMGGALQVAGNIELGDTHPTDGVEWNFGADPDAIATVVATEIAITLVPLDATNDVRVDAGIAARLEPDHAAAGADILYQLFQHNPFMTSGEWYIWDPLAALTLTTPDLVSWSDVGVVVRTSGPEAGRIVPDPDGRVIHAAITADRNRVLDALFAALRRGPPRP